MSTYNDLINVTFEDAVTYTNVDNSDILGVIMPHFWGPAGEISVLNQREFFETYPEFKREDVDLVNVKNTYAQIKSFFNNGGSRVAVYRPKIAGELFGNATDTAGVGNYLAFKYSGLPAIEGGLGLVITSAGTSPVMYTVRFTDASTSNPVVYEEFVGQTENENAVDSDGESTYLPTILKNKSAYMQIVTSVPAPIPVGTHSANWIATGVTLKADAAYAGPDVAAADLVYGTIYYKAENTKATLGVDYGFAGTAYVPGAGSEELNDVFALQDQLIPTIFLKYNSTLKNYCTATFISANTTTGSPLLPSSPTISDPEKFHISVWGKEKIKVFGSDVEIDCNAGVAGAYSRVAGETHVNQLASARSYGAYVGTLSSSISFDRVLDWSKAGVVCVYNSSLGPQIFGVRNTYAQTKSGSYFARANVSRTLAAILRNIIPNCLEAIHTDTAANAVTRKVFEANLNNVINGFIATQDLQADSKAICNASNNSDAQTLGGSVLNIILSLHFIGLVEKVNIKVIATDSSVTVNVA